MNVLGAYVGNRMGVQSLWLLSYDDFYKARVSNLPFLRDTLLGVRRKSTLIRRGYGSNARLFSAFRRVQDGLLYLEKPRIEPCGM